MIIRKINSFISHPYLSIKPRIKKIKYAVLRPLYRLYYGNNIIILESHQVFDGNSGAVYQYMKNQKKYKKYTFIWLSLSYKLGSTANTRRTLAFPFDYYSMKKDWLIHHAKFVLFDDIPIKVDRPNVKTVYLTHGCPPIKNVKGIINLPDFVDIAIASSNYTIQIASEQYSFPKEKFIVAGQPRNDILFEPKKDISFFFNPNDYKKVILWLPTFRKVKDSDRNDSAKDFPFGIPLFSNEEELGAVNSLLANNNTLLVMKLHPMQDTDSIHIKAYSNIKILSANELTEKNISTNALFLHSDALISDYSSTVFDYLLINKPIAYLFDDLDLYKVGLIDGYEELIAGCIMKNLDDFIGFIKKVIRDEDEFADQRKKVTDLVHEYQHGGFTKRIVELLNI